METTPASDTAEASVELTADLDRVWRSLTTPRGLEPWFGAGATIEPTVDGTLSLPDPAGGRPRHGRIDRLDDHARMDFTWWPVDRPVERSRVSIVLTRTGTGTRVTVRETAPRSVAGPAALRTTSPSASARSGSAPTVRTGGGRPRLVGAWTWRLALLTLACAAVPV